MGQIFGPDTMAQMAVNEEMLQNMVNEKVSQAAAQGVNGLMEQLLGEDMGILAAALETLDMQDEDDEEEPAFEEQLEQRLYVVLEETMSRA